ncbi:MAG TPA: type II toxin-antitoxin system RelE/ParE family toxin [Nitratifractor sp.]|nr:type II toxin-antitoxin system RelE/ParE family toxin [Nitratifractor sp.]HHH20849.1 type II toxin-antitoxin system RelE/ParE family toxin [Nitratifractor sp.]
MIKSFANRACEEFFITGKSKKVTLGIERVALRKLDYLNCAINLDDLKIPPANRLEKLRGDLDGFYSIRINKQYRIVFKFLNSNAYEVDIVDYH